MKMHYYLVANAEPVYGQPLPEPVVVATITIDPRFTSRINGYNELKTLAGKLGLLDFDITTADARDLPGYQLGLPFPVRSRR